MPSDLGGAPSLSLTALFSGRWRPHATPAAMMTKFSTTLGRVWRPQKQRGRAASRESLGIARSRGVAEQRKRNEQISNQRMLSRVLEDNVVQLPDARPIIGDGQDRRSPWASMDTPLPLGVCLAIWAALAAAGWLAVYLMVRFI
jgi:hypothetical protein